MRIGTSVLVSGVLALGLMGPVSADANTVTIARASYDNCTALNRDYKHGVMKKRYSKHYWSSHGATGKPAYRPKIYRHVYLNLDRDRDGIACEQ